MKILMRNKLVAVEATVKPKNNGPFADVNSDNNSSGIIKYKGPDVESDLEVGKKVYFADKRTMVTIDGKVLNVMESDNIIAVVEE